MTSNFSVIGIDNLNKYYDVKLKLDRLKRIEAAGRENFEFIKMDLCDGSSLRGLLRDHPFDYIVHMGAQAGVRYSLENPQGYIDSNIQGFFNLLEASKGLTKLKHFVYASSSSVYGGSKNFLFQSQKM